MKLRFTALLLVFILLSHKSLFAQERVLPADLSFQNFSHEDGLSDNYINSICQDSRGFIWISTPEGLNRFDGLSFKKFYIGRLSGNPSPSNQISSIIEYKKDHLLLACNNGLIVMNTIDQVFSRPGDNLLSTAIVSNFFVEDPNSLWLALNDVSGFVGIARIDTSLFIQKKIRIDPQVYKGVNNIHRLKNGQLLISTSTGYYFVNEQNGSLEPLSNRIKEVLGIKEIIFSYFDKPTNSIYTSVWGEGFFVISLGDDRVTNYRLRPGCTNCGNWIFATNALRDSRGHLWVVSEHGLSLFNENDNRFITYHHKADESSSIIKNEATFLFEDRENNLWVGTAGGLSKLSRGAMFVNSYKNEFVINGKAAEIYDIVKGADQRIYIATFGNGVFSLNTRTDEIKNYGKDVIAHTWSVRSDSNSIIVTGHDKKIYRLNPATSQIQVLNFLKPYQDTANLNLFAYTDRYGRKWYSMNMQQGLVYYPPGGKVPEHYSNKQHPPPFPHSYFKSVVQAENGKLWFGVNKRPELVSYDFTSNSFYVYDFIRENGVRLSGNNCLLADKNIIWSGTDGTGLIHLETTTKKLRVYTIEDGLSANNISSLIFDNKKRLWVGTTRGLSCLLPGQNRFLSFSRSDGLPEIFFNSGALYYDRDENRLYAGAKNTLISLDPDELLRSVEQVKPLHIDEILVNGKKIPFSILKELNLTHDQNNLQFSFTSVDFENPAGTSYFYKLEGADKDWIQAGLQRTASYTNLSDGNYRFHVKVVKTGSETETDAQLPFAIVIFPPYWKTWWFRGLTILVFIFLLYGLIRAYYQRKLVHQRLGFEKQQAVEQERTRIATDMHDDLGAGLTRIKFIAENISEKSNDTALQTDMVKLKTSSIELVENMSEIIWAMNEKNNTLEDLVFYLRSYAVDYCNENRLACEFILPENIPDKLIGGQVRRNVFLVLKESLHNIVKHAGAEKVVIVIRVNEHLSLSISDDGKGLEKATHHNGNGLLNMQQRASTLKGKLSVVNTPGTTIHLDVPI